MPRPHSARATRFGLFLAATAVAASPAGAQTAHPPAAPFAELDRYRFGYAYAGSQLKDHVYERSRHWFAAGDAQRDALASAAAVRVRQEAIRRDVIDLLGGLPASNSPLNARVTGTVQGSGFTIEKIVFEARPRHYVTANLYLPVSREGRTGAVLFLCGHHATAKQVAEYQNVCQTLVRAGLIVLAQDPIGQGERLSYWDSSAGTAAVAAGVPEHGYAGAQTRLVGDTLARYFLHDAMRSIDYLLTRPEVDPARIGVTGNSGGGTQTSLLMLADPRIAAAAPATFIMSRDSYQRTGQAQDAEQIWPGFTRLGYDHEDILIAMAPKPVCVLAVTSDFFPIEGARRTVARARRIWKLFDRGAALEQVEDATVHEYSPLLARAAARFFAQHLLGRDADLAGLQPQTFLPEQLWCTRSGQVRGDLPDAEFVFEANAARLRELEAARQALPATERKTRAIAWLRDQVFRDRGDAPLNPRRITRGRMVGDHEVDIAFWYPQPYLANLGMLIRARERPTGGSMPVTFALWDDGTAALSRHSDWIAAECARGRAVFVVNLSGMGPLRPDAINLPEMHDFYGTFHKLAEDLEWIGDSLVALRTYEVLRALDVLAEWPELAREGVRIQGEGRMGVHGKLAAGLDARFAGCEWRDGFTFAEFVRPRLYAARDVKSILLPGVLRYTDLDEL